MSLVANEHVDLAIIPARGGSVGLPGKNIRPLGGYPLIAWTIRAALASGCFSRVLVSTDSREIAELSVTCGADVPSLRPVHLATGETRSADVIRHILNENRDVLRFALLQPTSPFRAARHIQDAVMMQKAQSASSLVSVCAGKPLAWSYHMSDRLRIMPAIQAGRVDRRQDVRPIFSPNGAIYMCTAEEFLATDSLFLPDTVGFEMNRIDSLDIDDLDDFELASALVAQGLRTIDP